MSLGEKRAKAQVILAEVDALFHTAEKTNPQHDVTYLDIVRITDRVREHFDGKTPPQIEAGLVIAVGLCHPEKIEGVMMLKKGFGALLSCGGGTSLMWGIVYIIAHGLTVTTSTGILWWKTNTTSILLGGPVGIAIGVASMAVGVYLLCLKAPVKKRAIMAMDVIKKGVDNWGMADAQRTLPDVKWVVDLEEIEFFALVSLAWHLVDVDKVHSQEEMAILDHILRMRKPSDVSILDGMGSTPIKESIQILRNCKHSEKCFSLIKMIPEADGNVSSEEAEIIGLFEI